jgi:predicted AAA+ superfamily ATPase
MLDEFYQLSQHFLEIHYQQYQRYFIRTVPLKQRLSVLIGERGVGKTTTLIQHLLSQVNQNRLSPKILYVQTDHFLMGQTSLYEIAEAFSLLGGQWIAFDEIHKYANWSAELKSIYDTFPNLNIIASGSSALEIHKGSHDLSRRAIVYQLRGLSFREYLELAHQFSFSAYTLTELLENHVQISSSILKTMAEQKAKILPHFKDYLRFGYYPYFYEVNDVNVYHMLVEQNIHTTIESDLLAIYPALNGNSIKKIKQLLSFIASAVPFTPNWNKLKTLLDIGDDRTLKTYFKYLEDAGLIQTLLRATSKMKKLEAPEKIYLNNPNQMAALNFDQEQIGTVRETFFLNMLRAEHEVSFPEQGDFLVKNRYLFEVGGKKKGFEQVATEKDAYVACDDIEQGFGAKIPLWLFGFLY